MSNPETGGYEPPVEKPQPLYNDEGVVNDPEIARVMAESEKELRTDPGALKSLQEEVARDRRILGNMGRDASHLPNTTQEHIDYATGLDGQYEQRMKNEEYRDKMGSVLAEKLRASLTEEEIEFLLMDKGGFSSVHHAYYYPKGKYTKKI